MNKEYKKQQNQIHECSTCGYQWKQGQHGGHTCSDFMVRKDQAVKNWKLIEELTIEPVSIMLYMKSSTGHNVYLPAEILEVNDKGESLIATEGGVSKPTNIKRIYTHYALLTPPQTNQSNN